MERKVPFTKIHLARIDENLNTEILDPLIFLGRLTNRQIKWRAKRDYGENVTITDTEIFYQTYVMRVEEFINYGKIKEDNKNYG